MRKNLFLLLIIALAVFLRLNNLNWDQGFHLHPDERFLTMVGNAMKFNGFINYFNPAKSLFNPANIDFKFYVYGTFPVVFNKIIAMMLGNDDYNMFTIQGRTLSAFFDIFTLIIVFKLVGYLEKKLKFSPSIKYWSAFFYAIAVLPIQLSHYFAVDTFLSFFMTVSFYFITKQYFSSENKNLLFAGIMLGLSLACKASAIYIVPLEIFFIFVVFFKKKKKSFLQIIFLILYGLSIYFALRIAAPYYFESANIFNPIPSQLFTANLATLKSFNDPEGFYPPGIQWINKNGFFALINMAFFGLGLPYFLFLICGFFIVRKKNYLNIVLIWVIGFFIFQSFQYVKNMRYFIFLYPFFAIFAAFGINWFFSLVKKFNHIRAISLVLLLIWPLSFSSIYLTKNSRIQASEWIYENIPGDKLLLNEHWDDPLPLLMEKNYGKNFRGKMLPVFYPDNKEKWLEMDALLNKSDYYILSSNRGWGSISTVPDKYPLMSKFYKDLFEGKLEYQKVKEFTSYPNLGYLLPNFVKTLLGEYVMGYIDDSWADESFTVYDHAKVIIFKNYAKVN